MAKSLIGALFCFCWIVKSIEFIILHILMGNLVIQSFLMGKK